jgi:Dolichyl-phosphate-mannose-protein mannosyltransferase/PA14 domain
MLSVSICALAAATQYGTTHLTATEGLICEDFANASWQGAPVATRIQRDMDAPLLGTSLLSGTHFSTMCRGWLFVDGPGKTTFLLASDDGADLFIDGQPILQNLGIHSLSAAVGQVWLVPGSHRVRIRYAQESGEYAFALAMAAEGGSLQSLEARAVARRPLTRAEYLMRPFARSARNGVWLLCVGCLAYWWRRELKRTWLSGARLLTAWHQKVVPHSRRALSIVLAIAIGARVLLTLTTYAILWPDSDLYYATALAMLRGEWASHEIFRTPLFPGFMALFLAEGATPAAGLWMITTQRLLGVLATAMVYRIGLAAFSPAAAFYGALLWTVSPLQLYYETTVTSEALFMSVLVFCVWLPIHLVRSRATWRFMSVGVLCAIATLTRPVGKGFIFVVLALTCWHMRGRRHLATALTAALAGYLLCVSPLMYANRQMYGFLGISRGEGLGLFMRAFDIERLDPPEVTNFPDVKDAYTAVRASFPYVHYHVRDELDYSRGYSAVGADRAMVGFALETIQSHPLEFAAGVAIDWIALFISPHRSVDICDSSSGPVLCAQRNVDASQPAFPNAPSPGFAGLKSLVASYFNVAYWLIPALTPLAFVGVVLSGIRPPSGASSFGQALLIATVGYFTLIAVSFNTVEDRYRLPADPFIVLFAMHSLVTFQSQSWRPLGWWRQANTTSVPGNEVPPAAE